MTWRCSIVINLLACRRPNALVFILISLTLIDTENALGLVKFADSTSLPRCDLKLHLLALLHGYE
jgi:hypothetical protein